MTIDEFMTSYPNIGKVLADLIDLPEMEEDIQIGFENVKKSYSHNQLKEMDNFLEFGNLTEEEKKELESGDFHDITDEHPEWPKIQAVNRMFVTLFHQEYQWG